MGNLLLHPDCLVHQQLVIRENTEVVREQVARILDAAEVNPQEVNRILAAIPESDWQLMMRILRGGHGLG